MGILRNIFMGNVFNKKTDLSAYKTSGRSEPLNEGDMQTKAYKTLASVAPKLATDRYHGKEPAIRKLKMEDGSTWYVCYRHDVRILDEGVAHEWAEQNYNGPYDFYAAMKCYKAEKSVTLYVAKGPDGRHTGYRYETILSEPRDPDYKRRPHWKASRRYRNSWGEYYGVNLDPLTLTEVKEKVMGNSKYAGFAKVMDLFFDGIDTEMQERAEAEREKRSFRSIDPQKFAEELKSIEGYTPQYFAKSARITAREGKVGEEIVTQMKDGHTETRNTVKNKGDMIITNPNGEEYIVDAKTFAKKYEIDPANPKQYRPKGGPQEFYILDENVEFTAPWGEKMLIKAGGALNITDPKDVYGIQKEEFVQTYGPCDKDGNFSREYTRKLFNEATSKDAKKIYAGQLSKAVEPGSARYERLKSLVQIRADHHQSNAKWDGAVKTLPGLKKGKDM